MRKFIFASMAIFIAFAFQSFDTEKDKIKHTRFLKPHEEEAEEKSVTTVTFMDYVPVYSSSVFVNYNISRDSSPQNETSV